jgi:hypothetical protein
MRSFDISNMYTNIPTKRVTNIINTILNNQNAQPNTIDGIENITHRIITKCLQVAQCDPVPHSAATFRNKHLVFDFNLKQFFLSILLQDSLTWPYNAANHNVCQIYWTLFMSVHTMSKAAHIQYLCNCNRKKVQVRDSNLESCEEHRKSEPLNQACPTRRPWYTFLAPYFTLPTLTLIGISRKKKFWITVCFNFFRSTPMNTVFPLLQSCFLLYPFYCPLTPHFPFLLEKAPASQVIPSNK